MELPEPTGGDFVNLASGTYLAICYRFLDLGTHQNTYQGETYDRHEIMLGWETPEETFPDPQTGEVKPLVINKRYTWSMAQTANLRKDLESWRGQPFEKSDFGPGGFNTKKLIGVPCMLTVVRAPNAQGKEYSNVTGIGPIMKSLKGKVPALWNKPQYLSLSHTEFDRELFNSLHDNLKTKIANSPEYQSLFGDGPKANAYRQQSGGSVKQDQRGPSPHQDERGKNWDKRGPSRDELDDEIPF